VAVQFGGLNEGIDRRGALAGVVGIGLLARAIEADRRRPLANVEPALKISSKHKHE
jgi:hypothetical protein